MNQNRIGILVSVASTLFLLTAISDAKQENLNHKKSSQYSALQNEALISFELKKVSFSEMIKYLGEKYKLNIIADSYVFDGSIGDVNIDRVPKMEAIRKIGDLFERSVRLEDNLIIFQTKQPLLKPFQEEFAEKNGTHNWADDGAFSLVCPEPKLVETKRTASGIKKKILIALPQERLSLIAERLPLRRLAAHFEEKVGWSLSLGKELYERRFNAVLHNVTPGQCLEAITKTIGARQVVKIELSEAQKSLTANFLADKSDIRSARRRKSDEVLKGLMKSLTQEQKDKLASGSGLELDVNSMSGEMKTLAMDYVNSSLDDIQKRMTDFPLLDKSKGFRFGLSGLNFGSPGRGSSIPIYGTDVNGGNVGF